jgi:hypothetical protein
MIQTDCGEQSHFLLDKGDERRSLAPNNSQGMGVKGDHDAG